VLARLARVLFLVALLAGWHAALEHAIEHGSYSHEDSPLCDAFDALTACAPDATPPVIASAPLGHSIPSRHHSAPRVAQAPPFLSQGPPIASV
jgi:hypothetical protein